LYLMIPDELHYEGTVLLGDWTPRPTSGTEGSPVIAPGFRAVDILKCLGYRQRPISPMNSRQDPEMHVSRLH
jgi:hypothetical protein